MKTKFNKNEKLTDKAFSRLVLTSVLGILVCIVCLCSSTYAWFTSSKTSAQNSIGAGNFDLVISVSKDNGTEPATDIAVTESATDDGVWSCNLTPGKYVVTLTVTADTTVKGYCAVKVGNEPEKRTEAIIGENCVAAQGRAVTSPFTFEIEITGDEETTVIFTSKWGEAANPDIVMSPTESDSDVSEGTTEESTEESTEDITEESTEETTEA